LTNQPYLPESALSHELPPGVAPERKDRADLVRIVDRRYLLAFIVVTSLFFSWAFAAALNDILIRQFQKALALTRAQSSFIQLAFYIGYFCAALPAGLVIRRAGYKRTILIGLSLYAAGAFLFYPAASAERYAFFLMALYIIAFGLAFLETAANPYVSILGNPKTASSRLNLAQSFYGLGAIFGPIIGGAFIFSGIEHSPAQIAAMTASQLGAYRTAESAAVKGPYIAVGIGITVLALLVALTPFPVLEDETTQTGQSASRSRIFATLRHLRLRLAVVAQFCYVGAQVTVWSFFIDFTKALMPGLPERSAAFLLSASLGMLMLGRFSGAFIQARISPARLLSYYAAANVLLCLTAAVASGWLAVGALWMTSFFMSIMFPTIFALGVEDLRDATELGSSFLIMSIIGGAIIPPLTGLLSDRALGGIQHAMLVPAVCFVVCLAFAAMVPRMRRNNLS
jgi:FHS family L-fucose permease-like MFS transporter